MARSSRRGYERSESGYRSTGRDAFDISKRSLPLFNVFDSFSSRRSSFLSSIEDRRTWNPEGPYRPARSFSDGAHRLVTVRPSSSRPVRLSSSSWTPAFPSAGVAFRESPRVLICARRKIRREVLHAKGVAGSKGLKKYRRSFYSSVSC